MSRFGGDDRIELRSLRVGGLLCVLTLVLVVMTQLRITGVWDDAYMFVRYSDNLLESGRLHWNPGGPPTFGLTSPGYLLLVLPCRLLIRDNPALVVTMASIIGGVLMTLSLVILARRRGSVHGRGGLAALACLVVLAVSPKLTGFHSTTGMDTTFGVAWLGLYLLLVDTWERTTTTTRWREGLLAAVGAGSFLVRPELLLYSFAIPVAGLLGPANPEDRRRAVRLLLLTATVLALLMMGAALYFGSPLPLSFYAKSLHGYGPEDAAMNRFRIVEFLVFISQFWWLVVAAIALAVALPRAWWRESSAATRGIAAATLGIWAYHLTSVLPIGAGGGRFYFPTLAGALWLALEPLRLWPAAAVVPGTTQHGPADRRRRFLSWVLVGALLLPPTRQLGLWLESLAFEPTRLDFKQLVATGLYWPYLAELGTLPDDLSIATTEVGLPSVALPGKAIHDLSGLNDTAFAHDGFSAERLLGELRPDILYLPVYPSIQAAIESSGRFGTEYVTVRSGTIALRRDSPYYDRLRLIAGDSP